MPTSIDPFILAVYALANLVTLLALGVHVYRLERRQARLWRQLGRHYDEWFSDD